MKFIVGALALVGIGFYALFITSGADLSIGAPSAFWRPGLEQAARAAPNLGEDEALRRANLYRRPALPGSEIERLLRGRYIAIETIAYSSQELFAFLPDGTYRRRITRGPGNGMTPGYGVNLTWRIDQNRLCLEYANEIGKARKGWRALECYNVYATQSGEWVLALAATAKRWAWSDAPWEIEPQRETWSMLITWRAPIPSEALAAPGS